MVSFIIWILAVALPFLYFVMGYRNYLMLHANISLILGFGFMFGIYVQVYFFLRRHTQKLRMNLSLSSVAAKDFDLQRLLMEKKVTRNFPNLAIVRMK